MTAAGRGSAAATAAAGGGAAGVPTAPNPAAAPQPHAELAASAGSTAAAGGAATAALVAGAPKQGTATGPAQDDVRRAAETTAPLSDSKVQKRKVAMFLAYVGAGYLVSHERILCAVMLGTLCHGARLCSRPLTICVVSRQTSLPAEWLTPSHKCRAGHAAQSWVQDD